MLREHQFRIDPYQHQPEDDAHEGGYVEEGLPDRYEHQRSDPQSQDDEASMPGQDARQFVLLDIRGLTELSSLLEEEEVSQQGRHEHIEEGGDDQVEDLVVGSDATAIPEEQGRDVSDR